MTSKRFSSQYLYKLRNIIPINILIKKFLMIPLKLAEGVFRFLCTLCLESNTATNPKTNLARCFHCQRNFNTIDMAMIIRKATFVKSVKFLKKYYTICSEKNQIRELPDGLLKNSDPTSTYVTLQPVKSL